MRRRQVNAIVAWAITLVALLPFALSAQKSAQPAPTGLRVSAQGPLVTIVWTPVMMQGTSYRVFRGIDPSKPGAQLASDLKAASYVDARGEPGATYFYQVAAVYPDGTVRLSSPVSFSVPAVAKAPPPAVGAAGGRVDRQPATMPAGQAAALANVAAAAPTNLVATPMPTSVGLTWSAVPTFATYAVERNVGSGGQWTLLTMAPSTAYTDAAMDPATSVQYRVTAKYADGRSGTSVPVATRTMGPSNPPNLRASVTPHIITAQILPNFQAPSLASADVTLSWDPVPGAASYDVSGTGIPNTRSMSTTTFQVPTVSRGSASWQVVAYFMNGVRRFGDTAHPAQTSVFIGSEPVEGFNGVTHAGTMPAQVDFRWNAPHGATSFKLLRAESPNGPFAEVMPPNFAPFWTRDLSPELQRNKTYYYELLSIFPSAPVAWTAPLRIDIPPWATVTGLAAAPHGSGVVWLRWDQIPNASAWDISRAQGGGSFAPVIRITLAGAGGYADSGLAPGTTYRYRVCAVGGAAHDGSPYSSCAEVSVTTSNP